jgi:hypothetical protein
MQITAERRAQRWPGRVLLMLLAVTFLGAVAILVTGGTVVTRLPLLVSMRSPMNLMTASWTLLTLGAVATWRVRAGFALRAPDRTRGDAWVAGCALLACLAAIAPLAWHAVDLWRAGDYVEPPRFWRSAPLGADPATLVLGPPMHGLVGRAVRARYEQLGIDFVECAAWFGITASILALLALRMPATSPHRQWRAIGVVFLVWALGPFLTIAGVNTGLLLPQQLVRYVPVLANARIPGRALIVVSLAMAVLAACWAASRRSRLVYVLAVAAAAEQLAAPRVTVWFPRRLRHARGLRRSQAALSDGASSSDDGRFGIPALAAHRSVLPEYAALCGTAARVGGRDRRGTARL